MKRKARSPSMHSLRPAGFLMLFAGLVAVFGQSTRKDIDKLSESAARKTRCSTPRSSRSEKHVLSRAGMAYKARAARLDWHQTIGSVPIMYARGVTGRL